MATKIDNPSFVKAWLTDLTEEIDDKWYRIIPIWFIVFFAIGAAVAYFLPSKFWDPLRDTSTIVYTGLLTFNGIVLALSWSAFAKIYDIIGAGRFASFLRDGKVLNSYLFAVRYIHASQMLAMVSSIGALMLLQFSETPLIWQRVALGAMLGFGMYAIKQAASAVGIMQDLIHYRALFDADSASRNLRAV